MIQASAPQNRSDFIRATGACVVAAAAEGRKRRLSIVAYTGEPIHQWWSSYPVIPDYSGMRVNATVPILYDHNPSIDSIVGQASGTRVEGGKLLVEADCLGYEDEDSIAAKVLAKADAGFVWQASIGAPILRAERVEAGAKVTVNGREYTGPCLVAREFQLQEVSLVVLGADPNTSAIAAAKQELPMDFQAWLKASGIDPEKLSPEHLANLRATWDKANKPAANPPAPSPKANDIVAEMRAQATREADRIAAIRRVVASHGSNLQFRTEAGQNVSLEAHAISQGWDITKTELEALRASRANPAAVSRPTIAAADVVEAALCIAGRYSDKDLVAKFGEQTLQAARKQYREGISLQQVLLEAAHANGYDGGMVFPRTGQGLGSVLRAAFSTFSLPGILSNVMNKFLLAGYMHVEDKWRPISSIRSVKDFKTVTSYRMTGDFTYRKVGPTGELEHAGVGEESYTNKAETYGRMFSITRQDIINDDLGALTAVPSRIGRGAGLKLNDVFWTEFMDNASFFAAGNKNYFEGSTTNLQISSLKTALQKFRDQTDADGKPLAISPKYLLVPTALETTALEILRSVVVNTGGSSTLAQVPNNNIFSGQFEPLVSVYLGNSSYTGNSSTGWYLLADPLDAPTIEICFLNGVEAPTVETADANFNTLGIQMRGFHDFGVKKQDYRGGVKSKGAA